MTTANDDSPTLPLGEYEHYKGKRYRVCGIGRHTESDEYYVVYVPLYYPGGNQPRFWLRPYEMFIGTVEVDGAVISRFKCVDPV